MECLRDLAETLTSETQAHLLRHERQQYHRLTRAEIYAVVAGATILIELQLRAIANSRPNILPMPTPDYATAAIRRKQWKRARVTQRRAKEATIKALSEFAKVS